ncbi:MAG: hypothetical protein L6Q57_02625 [Alphaproteobacteria bacterium]|nr:hypothetical protein [Alphaproteobacteria bacterium]
MKTGFSQLQAMRAWVVFSGETDLPWLGILKRGFRHCFVILHDGRQWISVDPMAHSLDICAHPLPGDFDLPGWLRARGHKVVAAPLARVRREAPWMPLTCVEVVKRILGLHQRFILTPWQLYRYLVDGRWSMVIGSADQPLSTISQPLLEGDLAWEA